MRSSDISVNTASVMPRPIAARWLWLGVWALALAGVFAVILVIARTPQLKSLPLFHDLFSVALVIHVDLSVLTWFLAVICAFISMQMQGAKRRFFYAESASFWAMAVGMASLTLSPLFGEWDVVKSNYIPVLHNVVFFLGLSLMAVSVLLLSLEYLFTIKEQISTPHHKANARTMAIIMLLSLAAFYVSGELLPRGYDFTARYEYLFWAGGHSLQFAFILMMVIAWVQLFTARYGVEVFTYNRLRLMLGLLLLGVLVPFSAFFAAPVDSAEFQATFTDAMIHFGGLAPVLALWLMMLARVQLPKEKCPNSMKDAALTALVSSVVLFTAGGALGLLITGQNVTIPAHYHGSIVGVTLALMGYAYWLMPKLGYRDVRYEKMAVWQPVIYAVGQLMHIGGLGYSGGYGVLRKTAVGNAEFATDIKIALGVMGLGGLLAIIGGVLFVVVMVRAGKKYAEKNG